MEMAPSSSGLGRRPLKAEVEGSNPFGATMNFQPPFGAVFVSSHDFVPAFFEFLCVSVLAGAPVCASGVFFATAAVGVPCLRLPPSTLAAWVSSSRLFVASLGILLCPRNAKYLLHRFLFARLSRLQVPLQAQREIRAPAHIPPR